VALAQLLHQTSQDAEALEILGPVSGGFRADRLAARIRLEAAGDVDLDEAFAAVDSGDLDRGLDLLLAAAARKSDHEADIRRAAVSVLDELGFGHPRVDELRRRVAPAPQ
jgi:thioredoxin-like negative regulator of GroEL